MVGIVRVADVHFAQEAVATYDLITILGLDLANEAFVDVDKLILVLGYALLLALDAVLYGSVLEFFDGEGGRNAVGQEHAVA